MYHKCLSKFGYSLSKDIIGKQVETVRKDLTVKPIVLPAFKQEKQQVYSIYTESANFIFVPRHYGIEHFGDPEYLAMPEGNSIDVHCNVEPLSHQVEACRKLDSIFDRTKQFGDGGVLSLPCGYGKTYCAIKTACRLGVCTLIIVPTECLMDQWADAIRSFTGNSARIGFLQRDKIEIHDKDFVIGMIHSVSQREYDIANIFGLTIIDECHHVSSKTFSQTLLKIRTKFMLGLSATPNRRDGLSHVFYKFLGPLFHKEKRSGCNTVVIKKLCLYSTSSKYENIYLSGMKNTALMTTQLADFEERNMLLLDILRNLILQNRKILYLSSRRDNLTIMFDLLKARGFTYPDGKLVTFGFYFGKKNMSSADHKQLLQTSAKCDIVLGIDYLAKEGLDIPNLNTLVFGTPPGTEVEQQVGRILRKFHKDVNPLVVDIVDHTGNYAKHSAERDSWYHEEDYIIKEDSLDMDRMDHDFYASVRDIFEDKSSVVIAKKSIKISKKDLNANKEYANNKEYCKSVHSKQHNSEPSFDISFF
jgi:superfamily II DNA or RNA helicase